MKEIVELEQSQIPSSIGKWKAYPAYKDSGVEWLGEIPEHWEVRRLKYTARLSYGDSLAADVREEGNIPVFGSNGFVGYHSRSNTLAPALIIGRKGSFGKVNYSDLPCFAIDTTFYVDARNSQADLRWLFYSLSILKLDSMSEDSAIPGLSREFAYERSLSVPPLPEQRAIATFLDRETARINTLIAKKERLIELLQEKRAALISHAVTKGLDPDVKMKDSGVEWLGEIPAHWEVRRLKFMAAFLSGGTPSKENLDYWSGDIPWVSPKDMKYEIIRDTEDHITKTAIEESSTRLVHPGAVLIVVRSGILKHTIPIGINAEPVAINQDMKAVVLKPILKAAYFASVIRGHQSILLVEWRKEGTTVESIEFELLANTSCPIPPLVEQEAIISYLARETARIDALISRIGEAIEKLKEYSAALISAAVTGKIDVRGEV